MQPLQTKGSPAVPPARLQVTQTPKILTMQSGRGKSSKNADKKDADLGKIFQIIRQNMKDFEVLHFDSIIAAHKISLNDYRFTNWQAHPVLIGRLIRQVNDTLIGEDRAKFWNVVNAGINRFAVRNDKLEGMSELREICLMMA